MVERPTARATGTPFLEHYPQQGGPAELVDVSKTPFTLGRGTTHDRTVYSVGVSRDHAAIIRIGELYALRDLGSTNGTFVNGRRIDESVLCDGDIIHIAEVEFRFRIDDIVPASTDAVVEQTMRLPTGLHDSLIVGSALMQELIEREAVRTVYQPIVALETREVVGYEALGRGTHASLSDRPASLLQLAERCQMAVELSRLFRRRAIADSVRLPAGSRVFLNVHPSEIGGTDFMESLAPIDPGATAGHRFVLEIAESSVADVAAMSRFRDGFERLGYELAYDDFGAGQARLLELSDVPPHYLKLDRAMIEGIDRLIPRRNLVRALVRVVANLGVSVIAEGVESDEVARTCESLGCHLGQGFFFGAPREF